MNSPTMLVAAPSTAATAASNAFSITDWVVLGLYLVVLVGTGIAFSLRRPKTTDDYYLGERKMPVWAVAVSVLATALSAATFIGAPLESYSGDLTYLSTNIGGLLAILVVAYAFIPVFYKHNVVTVYELLDHRFGPGARLAASVAFMIGRVFASGSRVYIASIPLTMIVYGELVTSPQQKVAAIIGLSVISVLYIVWGGIRTIIWTDVAQTIVFVGAALAVVVVLLNKIPASSSEIADALLSDGKLALLRTGIDTDKPSLGFSFAEPYTLITVLTGWLLLNVASFGTDQDMAQRMLTCKNSVAGGRSAILSIFISVPVVTIFLVIGLLLYVFHRRPDLMGSAFVAPPEKADDIYPTFLLTQLPDGLAGLIMAGLFAVALTTLISALNAMSSTFVSDVYRPARPGLADRHYLAVGRWAIVAWALLISAFAVFCVYWRADADAARLGSDTLLQFALGVMAFAYAGLLGVYFTALFTRRGNSASVVAALIAGFACVSAMQPQVWPLLTEWISPKLAEVKFAAPWRILFPAIIALGVCLIGSRRVEQSGTTRALQTPGA